MMALVSVGASLEAQGLQLPTLDLFGSSSVNVIHWQPKGNFGEDYSVAIKNTDTDHVKKSNSVIDVALQRDCSLLLTAEYSFPYENFIEIANHPERWPKKGALWCLSMEGIERSLFDTLMNELQSNNAVEILLISRNSIDSERMFISALIYVFTLNVQGGKKLCIIPQLKIQSSSDPYMEHERNQMTPGKTIFYFDDIGNNAIFASLICADSFNHDNVKLFDEYTDKKLLLFNPQLNYSFIHQAEIDFLENILNYRNDRSFVIALNWAKETGIPNKGIKIQHGFSSIIRKPSQTYNETVVAQNYQRGACFANDKYKDIWYLTCEEHVLLYRISSLISSPTHGATANFYEPVISDYLVFNANELVSAPAECIIDWEWFNRLFVDAKTNTPHTCNSTCGICNDFETTCQKENYAQCCYKDIAMFCHSFFEQNIESNNPFRVEKIGIGGSYSKHPSVLTNDYNRIEENRHYLEGIAETIKHRHRLPDRFKKFADTHAWLVGERTRNVRHIGEDDSQTDAWIVFIYFKSKMNAVRAAINRRFSSNDEASLRNRILFCYIDPVHGLQYNDDGSIDIRDAKIWPNIKINLEGVR